MIYRLKIRIRKCYPDLGFCLVFFRLSLLKKCKLPRYNRGSFIIYLI